MTGLLKRKTYRCKDGLHLHQQQFFFLLHKDNYGIRAQRAGWNNRYEKDSKRYNIYYIE